MTQSGTSFVRAVFLTAILLLGSACERDTRSPNREAELRGENPQNAERGAAESSGGFMAGSNQLSVSGPQMTFQHAPIREVDTILNSTTPEALWSRSVELKNLKVQRVFRGGEYLLVGPGTNGVLLVRLRELHPNIKEGQTVNIAGVINPLGVDMSQWNLDPEDRKIASQHSVFISEMGIHPSAVD